MAQPNLKAGEASSSNEATTVPLKEYFKSKAHYSDGVWSINLEQFVSGLINKHNPLRRKTEVRITDCTEVVAV